MGRRKFTVDQVVQALKANGGMVGTTAKRLGCDRQTIYNYRDHSVKVRQALDDARQDFVELAESQLMQLVQKGNLIACLFVLKCLGGWRETGPQHPYPEVDVIQAVIQARRQAMAQVEAAGGLQAYLAQRRQAQGR